MDFSDGNARPGDGIEHPRRLAHTGIADRRYYNLDVWDQAVDHASVMTVAERIRKCVSEPDGFLRHMNYDTIVCLLF